MKVHTLLQAVSR